MILQSQICCNTPTFSIAAIFVKYCYTQPAVGCYNSWANLWCFGCLPLGERLVWNRSILGIQLIVIGNLIYQYWEMLMNSIYKITIWEIWFSGGKTDRFPILGTMMNYWNWWFDLQISENAHKLPISVNVVIPIWGIYFPISGYTVEFLKIKCGDLLISGI